MRQVISGLRQSILFVSGRLASHVLFQYADKAKSRSGRRIKSRD